jgi:hypothetical protein
MILFLGIYPKECKSGHNRGTYTLLFITAQFAIAKLWKKTKQNRCPTTDEWFKKMWFIYTWSFTQP